MSHKIHTSTSMTDAATVMRMLKDKGLSGTLQGTKVAINSPNLRNYVPTVLDLESGTIEGDSDNKRIYDALPQAYGRAACFVQAEKDGAQLVSEEVRDDGTVRLVWERYLAPPAP